MRRRSWIRGAVLAAVAMASATRLAAEVSMDILADESFRILILGTTEGPDPWGRIWVPHRDIAPGRILNASGAVRGDGRPDVSDPTSGTHIVVWAYKSGDFDIALAEWAGTQWGTTEFLTAATTDEVDPRLLVQRDGTVHVVWWIRQTRTLQWAMRQGDSNLWRDPVAITSALGGARPSLAEWEDRLHLAYERPSLAPGVQKEIVVARLEGLDQFSRHMVAQTSSDLPLDPLLHVADGRMWVDWKHATGLFGYAVLQQGTWSPVTTLPWDDTTWIGEEAARLEIRRIVLAAPQEGPASLDEGRERIIEPPRVRFLLPFREQRLPQ